MRQRRPEGLSRSWGALIQPQNAGITPTRVYEPDGATFRIKDCKDYKDPKAITPS